MNYAQAYKYLRVLGVSASAAREALNEASDTGVSITPAHIINYSPKRGFWLEDR